MSTAPTTTVTESRSPERFIDAAVYDEPRKLRMKSFMGEQHSEYAMMGFHFSSPDPSLKRKRETKRRERVVSNARALLDELKGKRSPSPEPEAPPPAIEEKKEEEEEKPPQEEEPPKEEEPKEEEEKKEPTPEPEPVQEEKEEEKPATPAPEPEEEKKVDEDDPAPVEEEEEKKEEVEEEEKPEETKQEEPEEEEKTPTPKEEEKEVVEEEPKKSPEPEKPKRQKYNGWMEKFAVGKSAFSGKNWKKRWFALTSSGILSYQEDEKSKPISEINVAEKRSRVVTRPSTDTHSEAVKADRDIVLVFFEGNDERRLLMRCPDAAEKENWSEAFEFHAPSVNASADKPIAA